MTPAEIAEAARKSSRKRTTEDILSDARGAEQALEEAKKVLTDNKEAEEKSVDDLDDTTYTHVGMDRPVVRKAIESRCAPFDLDELILTGSVSQVVPIVKGKLVIKFLTLSDADELWCDQMAHTSVLKEGGTNNMVAQMSLRLQLALSVRAINGREYGDVSRTPKGTPALDTKDPDCISNRADDLSRGLESTVMRLVAHNYVWFKARAIRLLIDSIFLQDG